MFTGIITDCGEVRSIAGEAGGRLVLGTGYDTAAIALGASIACGGCCLSVVDKGPGWLAFDVSRETLSVTTLGAWRPGSRVNLERALRLGEELGGHLVSGHVDGVGEILAAASDGESRRLEIAAPPSLARFIAAKGSIAVDGVSLTVNKVEGARFGVNIIPLTARLTTLGAARPGERVNLEIDLLARYVARLTEAGAP